jgi:hypothetical protein
MALSALAILARIWHRASFVAGSILLSMTKTGRRESALWSSERRGPLRRMPLPGNVAVLTCLPSPKVSELVPGQRLETMRPRSTWIEMSTLGWDEILRLSAIASGCSMFLEPSSVESEPLEGTRRSAARRNSRWFRLFERDRPLLRPPINPRKAFSDASPADTKRR